MHSSTNQEKINAKYQEQTIEHEQAVVADIIAQKGGATSPLAPFPESRGCWSNPELNRIIAKLDSLDLNDLEPVEYLEMLFYLSSGRSDTRHLAETTIEIYGSLAKILARPGKELRDLLKIDHAMTAQIAMARLCQRLTLASDLACRKRIVSASDFLEYAASNMREAEHEILRVIYLDQKCGIIKDLEMARGTVNTVAIYPREIAKHALSYCASSIILIHNHLSDDSTPSRSDILWTKQIKTTLNTLDITLNDHIIISRNNHISMAQEGYI